MRLKIIVRPVVLLLSVFVLVSPTTWAVDPADKARRPIPKPDPRARAIPELVCTSDRTVTVAKNTLDTKSEELPLRLRISGNLLYIGENAVNERFFATINRVDRRRWASGTAILTLDEALTTGLWTNLTPDFTRISAVRCEPFGTLPRP
jgi:hypothetical protein